MKSSSTPAKTGANNLARVWPARFVILSQLNPALLLLIGIPTFILNVWFGNYPSLTGYLGVVFTVLGLVGIGTRLILRPHRLYDASTPSNVATRIRKRFYIEFFLLVALAVLLIAIAFWIQ